MASSSSCAESWKRELSEASKLADDVSDMISRKSSLPTSGQDTRRYMSTARRKVAILRTKLDTLHLLLSKLTITARETNRRREVLSDLSLKANEMATSLNMSSVFANTDGDRGDLLGPHTKQDDILMNTENALADHGLSLVAFQGQIIKEPDERLVETLETVTSTEHIALEVNEELGLHTRLLDNLDQHVDLTDSHLQRLQNKLAVLIKKAKSGCSWLILLVIAIVILILVIWGL